MKIALVGNMNNIFFSLLRYFLDLDVKSDLYMFSNESRHFLPESDTYQIEKYKANIFTLNIPNSAKGCLGNIQEIKDIFNTYDIVIGCGIMPCIARRINRKLDIFIPYGDAFEYTTIFKSKIIYWPILKYITYQQSKAIKLNVKYIAIIGINNITKDAISRLKVDTKTIKYFSPMVYNREITLDDKSLDQYINIMKSYKLVVFSHTRHFWKNLHEKHHKIDSGKGLDKLIKGFAKYITEVENANGLLVFFNYGKDVQESKKLISKYNIDNNVLWIELMERKKIIQLIDYADIIVDALGSKMWGGVGYEGLSRGKMLMQNLEISKQEFKKLTNCNLPNIFNVHTSDGVYKSLISYVNNKHLYNIKSLENKQWFDANAGISCAEKYLTLCKQILSDK
jgi:hypothetical protein